MWRLARGQVLCRTTMWLAGHRQAMARRATRTSLLPQPTALWADIVIMIREVVRRSRVTRHLELVLPGNTRPVIAETVHQWRLFQLPRADGHSRPA